MDIYSKSKRSEIMSRVRNRRTAPEDKVASILRELGIKYRRNVKTLPGQPDFVVKSRKTVIFVNGCFWHGHPNCKRAKLPDSNKAFWENKIATNKRRDRRTAVKLRKEGWHIITVWQCRLRKPAVVLSRLKRQFT
ncbi:very short patch repair endonuclease [Planctomycetota bacterium]